MKTYSIVQGTLLCGDLDRKGIHKKEHDWVIRRDVDGPESVI